MLVFDPPTNTLELGEQIKKDMSRDILRKRQHLHTRLHICFSTEIFEECLTQIQESLFEHGLTLEVVCHQSNFLNNLQSNFPKNKRRTFFSGCRRRNS